MFLLNLGYRWGLTSLEGLRGVVILPVFNSSVRVSRDGRREHNMVLCDPQLYLAGLQVENRSRACGRLAGYPWFAVPSVPAFDRDSMNQTEWEGLVREHVESAWPARAPADAERACLQAVEFQAELGCTQIILPAPLVDTGEDEGATVGEWLDQGIAAAAQLEVPQPLLATVAVAEGTLSESAFSPGGLLEALSDQVTARSGVDGVYIVVVQTTTPGSPFSLSEVAARGYLRLVAAFGRAGVGEIVTNFADLCGFVALAAGATRFVTGDSLTLRSVSLEGFVDRSGGIALPRYYSHKTAGEYLSESELDELVRAKLVRRVADRTIHSAPLLDVLLGGGSASSVPGWAESRTNIALAHKHYIARMIAEGRLLHRLAVPEKRRDAIVDWLETAEATALYVARRLQKLDTAPVGRRPPLDIWRELLDDLP